ncbi:citrate synthase [Myxococcaceae bacterium]|nr:citrate synthase [Myxococcaceae bacterium]
MIKQSTKQLLTAREAAAFLGVKLPTLYAYVSRGLLRSHAGDGGRARRYRRAELAALRHRARGERGAEAAGALRWGEPVLDSSITAMTPEGPLYRGEPAVSLARRGVHFESVAEFLWGGSLDTSPPRFESRVSAREISRLAKLLPAGSPPFAWQMLVVSALAPRDTGRFSRDREAVVLRARSLVRWLVAALALAFEPRRVGASLTEPTVARAVAAALGVGRDAARLRAIDRLLVLLADHELNASTFAARVAASAEADPCASLLAGLATLSGPLHGGASDRVEALLSEIPRPADAARIVHERMRRGERVPGFGHGYYAGTDPRAGLLLEAAREIAPRLPELRKLEAVMAAMAEERKPGPNVDMGAVALRCALGMPRGAAVGTFAVGRSAGWMAHVIEQYGSGTLLRPRARFVAGEAPGGLGDATP